MTQGKQATGIPVRFGDELHSRIAPETVDPFPSVADAIYEQLWRRIVNREFAPGMRLAEETLARELGISRTPVREALLRLGQVGLVRVSTRRGFSVPVITPQDVIELYDVRTALETFATRRATPCVTAEEIAGQRKSQQAAFEQVGIGSAASAEQFVRADLALHQLLQQRGGNPRSARLLSDVMGQLSLFTMRAAQHPLRNRAAIVEHQAILDELDHRHAGAAAQAMETHLQGVKQRALEDLESFSS